MNVCFAVCVFMEDKFNNEIFYFVQALLKVYLLPDVTSRTKQVILLYVLCDLLNVASSEISKTQVLGSGLRLCYFH